MKLLLNYFKCLEKALDTIKYVLLHTKENQMLDFSTGSLNTTRNKFQNLLQLLKNYMDRAGFGSAN